MNFRLDVFHHFESSTDSRLTTILAGVTKLMHDINEAIAEINKLNAAAKARDVRDKARDDAMAKVQTELEALKANSGLPDDAFAQLEEAISLVNSDLPPVADPGETDVPPAPPA